jgi:hypothetical protein
MLRRQGWLALTLFLQGAVGCAAEGGAPTAAPLESDAVAEQLKKLGFRSSGLDVQIDQAQNIVRVDGDILFHEDALLAGGYAAAPAAGSAGFVPKGYIAGPLVSPDNARNIRLAYDNVPSELINYVDYAASEWAYGTGINISEGNTGPTLTVHGVVAADWPGPCDNNQFSCGFYPNGGNPGDIWVELTISVGHGCNWTPSLAQAVMTHEMGHTLGFAHPEDAAIRAHINGTADVNDFPDQYYPSIMHADVATSAAFDEDSCEAYAPYLEADDRVSASLLYPQ